MRRCFPTSLWLATTLLSSVPALAQTAAPEAPAGGQPRGQQTADEGEEEIVVQGQKPRGSVIGDIQPELTFNAGDIRALGVSSITDLLTELGPQLSSTRGGSPVVLLEGRRVSSFREIATIPAEAIQRAEVLPEEVALKYGYPANQKVLNIVLRRRFKSITVEGKDKFTTDGGANNPEIELGLLTIRRNGRLNLNLDYENTATLAESQRGITTSTGGDTQRSLAPSDEQLTLTATYAHTFSPKVSASLNGEMSVDRQHSLIGASTSPDVDVFQRTAKDLSLHLGSTVNADFRGLHNTLTTTYDHDEGRTISVRGVPADVAQSTTDTVTADLTSNVTPYRLPAGDISVTARLGGTFNSFSSKTLPAQATQQNPNLDRTTGLASLSVDVPVFDSPSPFLGRLSVNGNVQLQTLSDFGGLTSYGYGATWTPRREVSLIASFASTQSAPTMQQIGNPQIATPQVPVFDYTTGQSVLVTRVSGGNTALLKAEKREWRLGLTLKPFTGKDVTFSVDYNHASTDNGIMSLPALTAATQDAFPSRFIRDDDGNLIRIIGTPVNIDRQESGVLRWGFNFSKALKTPKAQADALRAAFMRAFAERQQRAGEAGMPPPPPEDGSGGRRPGGEGGPGGRGPGGFGGPGGPGGPGGRGPGGGNRITFAVYHSVHLTETARLAAGQPTIDLLNGGTIGSQSGKPRHEVEVQAGVSHSGFGLRLTGQWQSATRVVDPSGTPSANLHFGSLATFNLRLFANPSQVPGLIGKHPWMRGMRVSLAVNNLLNTRQKVTDGTGATPYAYQPAYLDPLGRTVMISVRKLFF